MTLSEATSLFLAYSKQCHSTADPHSKSEIHELSLLSATNYYSNDFEISEITSSNLRDFLARWYVERASGPNPIDAISVEPKGPTTGQSSLGPLVLIDSIGEFVAWIDQHTRSNQAASLSPVLHELRASLPAALAITKALSKALRNRAGAFSFPEFLTSFEEGGSSQYDIDVPGNVGAIDGYFRIVRIEGSAVEAEELISEDRVWPIAFPSEAAPLLAVGYIINLELVRKVEGWQIAACGFTYPPGTEIG
jgi:hypothetical protein